MEIPSSSSASSSQGKVSYSPFGKKPVALNPMGDSLYAAPPGAGAGGSGSTPAPPPPAAAASISSPPATTSSASSSNNGVSYMEALGGSNAGMSSSKSSYSPFGNSKPMAASGRGDSLYSPPPGTSLEDADTMAAIDSITSIIIDHLGGGGGSYLQALGGSDAPTKASYSPFKEETGGGSRRIFECLVQPTSRWIVFFCFRINGSCTTTTITITGGTSSCCCF